jgi:hypothetical protein
MRHRLLVGKLLTVYIEYKQNPSNCSDASKAHLYNPIIGIHTDRQRPICRFFIFGSGWKLGNPSESPDSLFHGHNTFLYTLRTWSRKSKKFWEELIAYFPLILRGPHRKGRVQQLFYCYVCVCCRGNVFTEPLPSSDKGIHIRTHRLRGGI